VDDLVSSVSAEAWSNVTPEEEQDLNRLIICLPASVINIFPITMGSKLIELNEYADLSSHKKFKLDRFAILTQI